MLLTYIGSLIDLYGGADSFCCVREYLLVEVFCCVLLGSIKKRATFAVEQLKGVLA